MDDLSLSQSYGGLHIANPDDDVPSDRDASSPARTPQPSGLRQPPPSSHPAGSFSSSSTRPGAARSASHAGTDTEAHNVSPLGYEPTSYGSVSPLATPSGALDQQPRLSHRQSMPFAEYNQNQQQQQQHHHHQQSQLQHPQYQPQYQQPYQPQPQPQQHSHQQPQQSQQYLAQGRDRPYYSYSNRPSSGLYSHPNMSSGSGSATESTYQRVRSESSQSSNTVGGVRRSASKAAAAAAMSASNPTRVPSGRQYAASQQQQPQQPTQQQQPQQQPTSQLAGSMYPPRRSSRATNSSQEGLTAQQPPPVGRMPSYPSPADSYSADAPLPQTAEEWQDRGAAQVVQKTVDKDGKTATKVVAKKGVRDFIFGRTLGEGSYSQVLAATDRTTKREYAIKILDKKHIIKEKKVKYVNIEKDTLNRLTDHPGVVRLYYTFQDERSLYFVIDVAPNGELLGVLKKYSSFDEEGSRFYGAEILDAIEYMHSRGIIHRDLKPENVLLDEQMHVKITDFGTAKILDLPRASDGGSSSTGARNDPMDGADTDRAVSFVGTAEYVSPELLTDKNACKASDLWAFGCIIYQLLAGRPPFKAGNEYLTFQKIVKLEYHFPDGFPSVAKDLVKRLLVLDPKARLPIDGIKAHPFFHGIEWGKGLWKQKPPKLRPYRPQPSTQQPTTQQQQQPQTQQQRDATVAAARAHESFSGPSNGGPGTSMPKSGRAHSNSGQTGASSRPQPRVITELAPPTQLDIDWSPVLTRPNERVLKLGQLTVYSTPAAHSPTSKAAASDQPIETPSKLSRFFGATATKKRTRLVMISSGARLIIAPSGGDKKEAKTVIDLADRENACKTQLDSKGYTVWCVYTRDRNFTFEDTKSNTGDSGSSVRSTEEWMECIESAKEHVQSQSMASSYSGESRYNGVSPMSPSDNIDTGTEGGMSHRVLRRDHDNDSISRKRFSKRHSKNGLTAVF